MQLPYAPRGLHAELEARFDRPVPRRRRPRRIPRSTPH
jgi:hypothetical protein